MLSDSCYLHSYISKYNISLHAINIKNECVKGKTGKLLSEFINGRI